MDVGVVLHVMVVFWEKIATLNVMKGFISR